MKGHWFGGAGNAVVILRSTGQVLNNVIVKDKTFTIDTEDLGRRVIKRDRIKTIVYQNLPSYPTDMLRMLDGTELNGVVTNDPVTLFTEDLGKIQVPRANLLSIIW
jgi:hypothetical protein